ncbi:MAG TPA: hypothetical protein VFX84_01990 [Candidatus Saccharimonadales bacterium]|nr:hypothetical protein [Candidatus Saccharimonadales bacterium]
MKPKQLDQKGFLPLLIMVLLLVLAAVYFVFTRVLNAEGSIGL